ncbi:MAG TPA: DUF4229 domain-containing protein [Nocardioides sp.]|uniref:DUF4229 domain-containing protein n=1 Tax=Nocardioides sp. TaxID=35761 RepID=UPI002EDAC3E5
MKEFLVYTALRLLLLVATFAILAGAWILVADTLAWFPVLLASFIVSGIASYFLLNPQRAAFARRVEQRAQAASQRFDEMRSKED